MDKKAACNECAFFDNETKADAVKGLCRFNPPIFQIEEDAQAQWPIVTSSDWCGHFESEGA